MHIVLSETALVVVVATIACMAMSWHGKHRVIVKERHVVITGGSAGIGLALARQFLRRGARVTLIARTASKLHEARAALSEEFGPKSVYVQAADVGDAMQVCRQVGSKF
jgi:NADP-dependent 3-hydroxy acid dehydrogenase YdfG